MAKTRSSQSRCHAACAFTLIELLAVMVLMIVLLGVALPAFTNLASGAGVDGATRIVGGQLRLARQYAITKRQRIAVIMPGPGLTATAGSDFERALYACLRPAVVSATGSSSVFTFVEWVENTNWTFLPTGASIMEADNDVGIKGGSPVDYQRIPEDNSITQVNGVDLTTLGGGNSVDGMRAVVFAPTGRVLGTGRHVTVGDATYAGGTWVVRNPADTATNKSAANQFTISVDEYTGRAIVRTPEEY